MGAAGAQSSLRPAPHQATNPSNDAQAKPPPKASAPGSLESAVDPFRCVDSWTKYRVPPLTCARALQHAAQDNTELYLSLLLPELRPQVDRLVRASQTGWHSARQPTRLPLPELGGGSSHIEACHLAVTADGVRMLALFFKQIPAATVLHIIVLSHE